jgi:hypothetical protein
MRAYEQTLIDIMVETLGNSISEDLISVTFDESDTGVVVLYLIQGDYISQTGSSSFENVYHSTLQDLYWISQGLGSATSMNLIFV